MSGAVFGSLDTPGVKVRAFRDGGVLRLVMSGSVEEREPGVLLDPYWAMVDEAARREGITRVELDIAGLDFMNSSGILTLVRWMLHVKDEPAYEIVIRHDRELTWQKTNVPVLAKLAPAVVRVALP